MVKEMMVEREEAIREELIARQTRIEELQLRLQRSERRAETSSVAAAKEAETQKELMKEIEEQEKAQRQQEEALETERQEALQSAAREAGLTAEDGTAGVVVAADADPDAVRNEAPEPAVPTRSAIPPTPSPRAPEPTEKPEIVTVTVGEFFPPAEVDTLPVVIKSQSLEWPRNAARSKGKGVVVVQLTVNASGGVDEVEMLRADHTGWGIPEAAVEAASGYRYKPGTKNGVAITTHAFVTWRYDFTLE
jgi:TonB family protein